jgi:hypothetical protein
MTTELRVNFPVVALINRLKELSGYRVFTKRHKNLMLHKPKNTSLFMATGFNKINVMEYLNNYEHALKSGECSADKSV